MNKWYIRVKTNKQLDAVKCEDLKDMYRAISCDTIQIVRSLSKSPFVTDVLMILDDNGKIDNKRVNVPATIFYAPPFNDGMPLDFIVGDVLIGVLNQEGDDIEGFASEDEALDFGIGLFKVLGSEIR